MCSLNQLELTLWSNINSHFSLYLSTMTESHKRKREDSSVEDKKSLLTQSAEISFPRGGASVLTPLELKEISNEAKKDVLFEQNQITATEKGPKSKKHKKSKKIEEDIVGKTKTDSVTIDYLSFKLLNPGSIVLGQIKHVHKMELVLSLSDNLNGFIPITNISAELTKQLEDYQDQMDDSDEDSDDEEMINYGEEAKEKKEQIEFPKLSSRFSVGQWLRAKVVESSSQDKSKKSKKQQKKRIELSIEPEKVNESMDIKEDVIANGIIQASVKSIEDHGAILNVGKSKLSGFVSKKELANGGYSIDNLEVGSVLLFSISKTNDRTITCKVPYGAIKKQPIVSTISSIDSILPGMLVDALISEVTPEQGLVCKIHGIAHASINYAHLGVYDPTEIKHKFALGSTVKARITSSYLKNGEKKLQLSLLPNVLGLKRVGHDETEESAPLEAFPVGHIFDDVVVKGKDSSFIFVDVGSKFVRGQVHKTRVSEDSDKDMDFKIGSHHKARVLGYSQVDNLFSLTMNKKQIEEKFLTVDDIPIGGAVTAEVLRIVTDKGLKVKISDNFEAFVPSAHMSDIKLIYPERKFKIGGKVKGRVLNVTRHSGKVNVLVTLKKSLVNIEDDEVVGKFEDLEVGKRTPATVEKFHTSGCIVSFFGSVKAFLPNAEISETFVKRPEDHFKLNQTVKVRVLSIDPENKRVKVSCRVSDALSETQKKAMTKLVPGKSVVSIQVVERQKDNLVVELDGSNLRGFINAGQLIDGNYEQNRAALKKQKVGATLEALVLEKNARTRIVNLTTKPSLLKAAKEGSFPTQFQDIVVSNKELRGYVKSVNSNGLFVSFGNGLTGLVLPRYASEGPIEDLTTAFFVNQSVSCYVVRIDEEKKRFLLSLKKIANNSKIEPTVNPVDPEIKTLDQFVPGVVTKAVVKSVKSTQLNVQLADNQKGRIDISQVFDNIDEIKDPKKPLAAFKNGDVLDVKIIGYHDARTFKFLPITHRKSAQIVLELSARKSVLKDSKTFVSTSISDLSKGDEVVSYINNYARGYVWVTISPSLKAF
ncbi:unnamed protein product [Ambrosiozyma monospora]|uniref:Unnamed protein product n=1 Tax=Ambrosiozyma monospora TaxID=43982 RepID=A0ACB5SXL4_AMBMO|nr:unnamed protein product [Ambrosiozyma monospora]